MTKLAAILTIAVIAGCTAPEIRWPEDAPARPGDCANAEMAAVQIMEMRRHGIPPASAKAAIMSRDLPPARKLLLVEIVNSVYGTIAATPMEMHAVQMSVREACVEAQ